MKWVRLLVWLYVPLIMGGLTYLFLLPPDTTPAVEAVAVGVLILDPLPLAAVTEYPDACPFLTGWATGGLTGSICPTGSVSMDEAILEINTGMPARKLRYGIDDIDPVSYRKKRYAVHGPDRMDLQTIVRNARRRVCIVHGASDGTISEQVDPETAGASGLTMVRVERGDATPEEYLKRIHHVLSGPAEDTHTWIVISPMTEVPVSEYWDADRWLADRGYLHRTATGDVDYTQTRVFYGGSGEPGLRINREETYGSGVVSRIEYEALRKTLAADLRAVPVPGSDPSAGFQPLFPRIFPGERIYPARAEGHFPDIVWEKADDGIAVTGATETGPTMWDEQSPRHHSVSGGWCLFTGMPFNSNLHDRTRLDALMAADVTPTVLYLLRLPVARDMDGRVLRPIMIAEQHRSVPVMIDSYAVYDPLVEQNFR
ncbi:hypothetical protein JXA80_11835 [bacterium]|nr:hypothetical protein [candidate division CSSED10-310 bacterium]